MVKSSKKIILQFPKNEEDVKKLNKYLLRLPKIKNKLNKLHDELDDIKRQYYPVIDDKGLRVPPEKSGANSIVDDYGDMIDKVEYFRYQIFSAIKAYKKELDNVSSPNVQVRVVSSTKPEKKLKDVSPEFLREILQAKD